MIINAGIKQVITRVNKEEYLISNVENWINSEDNLRTY